MALYYIRLYFVLLTGGINMTFRDILQNIVNYSTEQKISMAVECYASLLPTLASIDKDTNGLVLLTSIFGTAVAADGQVTPEEAAFISAMLKALKINVSYDDVIKLIKNSSSVQDYELIHTLAGALNSKQKADLVTFVACICSIDDRISKEEYAYLSLLMDA